MRSIVAPNIQELSFCPLGEPRLRLPEDDPYNSLLTFLSSPQSPHAVRELRLQVHASEVNEGAARILASCLERLDNLRVLQLVYLAEPTDILGASQELLRALCVRDDGRPLLPNLQSMEFKSTKYYRIADRETLQILLETVASSRNAQRVVFGTDVVALRDFEVDISQREWSSDSVSRTSLMSVAGILSGSAGRGKA
ncbi:hypothetical protein BD626DRAFT_492786 [Schizophyllum amplum]|uniref:FBD domain-containing protein n=1 Tax=Schizophyllum amplum TaxID=97359 RepID=A0A550CG97_9AGAR|nr:hypothetical protein BD626DRAFT_492786 [Auriculariopsis ampla]